MQAFELTDEMKQEGFSGGTVHCGGGSMFDVGEALANGDGVILVEDDMLGEVLSNYPALKSISTDEVPQGTQVAEVPRISVVTHHRAPVPMPPTYQTNDVPGQQRTEVVQVPEIAAQHASDPATPEDAIKAGEAVSGPQDSSPRPGVPSQVPPASGNQAATQLQSK